ncbi:MAG TPA: glycosyltransferase family 4 protein [Segetibacter sp.]|nr:glycosyltransferase family 4 protein [Segetibacter sp.]
MEKHLHIICLNVPYPVDYGGVFDLFYKLPALQQQGVKIHLHCFEYGRGEQTVLNQYCASVSYYKRERGLSAFSLQYPYIVSSRRNKFLLDELAKDDYPILMEGVHCTYLLNDKRFKQRKCFVRLHNVEYIYYRHLFSSATSLPKKLYFLLESQLLKRYEKKIAAKASFFSVTPKDAEVYQGLGSKAIFFPVFLPDWKVNTGEGKGSFCLYHGDLSVAENEKAATWLLQAVFNDLSLPFVVAGKNPSEKLVELIEGNQATCLIANPDENEMQDLIAKAHVNIIPSYNTTGIKLKLLNALFNGRHCLVNQETIEGTGLENACFIAATAAEFKTAIKEIYVKPFCENERALRHQILDHLFDNEKNAEAMTAYIFS